MNHLRRTLGPHSQKLLPVLESFFKGENIPDVNNVIRPKMNTDVYHFTKLINKLSSLVASEEDAVVMVSQSYTDNVKHI